jgi:hypothetical protein
MIARIYSATTVLVWLMLAVQAAGQNVSGYGMMPDPTLFLLREPAVHRELQLTEQQRRQLVQFNETFDGILMATRNMPPPESQPKIAEVLKKSREHVKQSFSVPQQQRLRQIMYRLRGLSCVLLPSASAELELSESQKQRIEAAVKTSLEKITAAQTETFQGKEAYEKTQRAVMAARKEEQDTILQTLTDLQRQKLRAMVGPNFDLQQLSRVTFKAPDLEGGTEWINSQPLSLEDLRGKVVALHFWAFG